MARYARATNSVQLFPFLAVLVCVMGALIFLLLVTTRQLRDRALARALAALPVAAIPAAVAPEASPAPLPSAPAPIPPVDYSEQTAARAALLEQLAEQQRERLQKLQTLEQQLLLAEAAQRRVQSLQEELNEAERQLGVLAGQAEATRLAAPKSDAERQRLEQQILELRRRLKQLQDQQQADAGKFALVPFEGKSGTTRRPIFIECTETGFRFMAEDVVVGPAEIEGFTESYNPLLAGAAALSAYWNQQARAGDPNTEPYVLLIVRPSGTLAYYLSQRLLARLKTPFGYELLPEDMQLSVPAAEPGAKAACEAAVQKLLAERNQTPGAATGPRGAGSDPRAVIVAKPRSAIGQRGPRLDDLDVADGVGERSWENVERFEGREHRQAGVTNGAQAPPSQAPRSGATGGNASSRTNRVMESSPGSSASSEVTTADFNEGQYPSFAARRSRTDSRSLPYEQLQRRRWGQHASNATIGIEHEIVVRVDAQRMIVDDAVAIPVPSGISRNDLFDRLLTVIDRQAHTWGPAPAGFFWVPSLKFVISPGGNQVYERISPLLVKSGLSSIAEFTLDEAGPTTRR